jgi:hypothetical protein
MQIARAHFEFQERLNKLHTFGNPNFYDYEIDALFDRAQLELLKGYYSFGVEKGSGFEVNQFAISALSNLVIKSPGVQSVLYSTEYQNGLYELNLGNLLYDIAFPVKVEVEIKKGLCRKKITLKQWQHDDVKNRINQPSWNYGKVHGNFAKSLTGTTLPRFSSLYLDALNVKGEKEFDVLGVFITYIKRPRIPWLGTYDLTTNLQTLTTSNVIYEAGVDAPVDFELEEIYHNQIVDMAASFAARDLQIMTAAPSNS